MVCTTSRNSSGRPVSSVHSVSDLVNRLTASRRRLRHDKYAIGAASEAVACGLPLNALPYC